MPRSSPPVDSPAAFRPKITGGWCQLEPDRLAHVAQLQRQAGGRPTEHLRVYQRTLSDPIPPPGTPNYWPGAHPASAPALAERQQRLVCMVDCYPTAGWHLSLSHQILDPATSKGVPGRYPTWDEISDARYRFVPDGVLMVMHLPPRAEFVNLHRTTFHLYELPREEGTPTP